MADLVGMNADQLLRFLNTNANLVDDVAARFADMVAQFEQRHEQLSKDIGNLRARDSTDENRIDDLIELRDKINDGFYVLRENEQQYPVTDRLRATNIVGNVLRALERTQDYLHECCQQFFQRNEERIKAEEADVRTMIRYVDHNLADAHVQQMAAFLGING